MQSIDSIETYTYGIQKMINFDDVIKEETKQHNPNWPEIPDHPQRILIIGASVSGKTSPLFNLINQQKDIDKIYLYAKDLNEEEILMILKLFTENSVNMDDIYKNIKEYNPNKERKILIIFDDMIAEMLNNKKLNPIVTELFISGRKLTLLLFLLDNVILLCQKILD